MRTGRRHPKLSTGFKRDNSAASLSEFLQLVVHRIKFAGKSIVTPLVISQNGQ